MIRSAFLTKQLKKLFANDDLMVIDSFLSNLKSSTEQQTSNSHHAANIIPSTTTRLALAVNTSKSTQFSQSGLQILLAEDNTINQRLAIRLLEKLGHQIFLAKDGLEAVNAVSSQYFDIVLMDIQMPTMGGIAATHHIRTWCKEKNYHHIPIIAMTAHAMQGDQEHFLSQGMDGYISKPIIIEELVSEISRVLHLYPPLLSTTTMNNTQPPACFDYDLALEIMGGDPSFLTELAQIFINENPERMAALRLAIIDQNSEQIYLIAHKLKGESANFGRPYIEGLAHEISQMGKEKRLIAINERFKQLEEEVAKFIADLQYRILKT